MNLISLFTQIKKPKRVGRGEGGYGGKTAGRGTKGQKSRTGFNIPKGFEGGQSTITTRTPKKRGGLHKRTHTFFLNYSLLADKVVATKTKLIDMNWLLEQKIISKNDLAKVIKISGVPENITVSADIVSIKNIPAVKTSQVLKDKDDNAGQA